MTIQQRDRRGTGSSFTTRKADRGKRQQTLDRIHLREAGL